VDGRTFGWIAELPKKAVFSAVVTVGEQEADERCGAACSFGAAQVEKRMWGMAVFLLLAPTFQSMSWSLVNHIGTPFWEWGQ